MGKDTSYSPLTDAEWKAVDQIIAPILNQLDSARNCGRPRMDQRPVVDMLFHSVSTGITLGMLSKTTKIAYPSPMTGKRFHQFLVKHGLLSPVLSALYAGRPNLDNQFKNYSHSHQFSKIAVEERPDTWGVDLSALPWWGQPATP
jgi:hypothetical protein